MKAREKKIVLSYISTDGTKFTHSGNFKFPFQKLGKNYKDILAYLTFLWYLGSVLVNGFWINFVHEEIKISIYVLLFRVRLG